LHDPAQGTRRGKPTHQQKTVKQGTLVICIKHCVLGSNQYRYVPYNDVSVNDGPHI